jgi:hypothetical protein
MGNNGEFALESNLALLFRKVHHESMRTRANINLDNDVYDFASAYASAKGLPLGSAVSELLRQRAEQMPESPVGASSHLKRTRRGYFVKAKTGKVITPEMVKESAEDDLD